MLVSSTLNIVMVVTVSLNPCSKEDLGSVALTTIPHSTVHAACEG